MGTAKEICDVPNAVMRMDSKMFQVVAFLTGIDLQEKISVSKCRVYQQESSTMSESVIQLGIIAMNVKATGKFDSKLIIYLLPRLQYFVEIWQISYHVLFICTVMPTTIVQVILSVNRGLVSKQFLGAQEKEEAPIYMQKTFVSNQRLQTLSSMAIV